MSSPSTTNPRRTGAQEQVVPGYLKATKASQQRQLPPVRQTTGPKPPVSKKNASPTPQRATQPSTLKPFNTPKTGSQASRASSKGATPTSAKRPENKTLASTTRPATSTELPIPASLRAAPWDASTPAFDLSELQDLSYPPFGPQTLPLTPPQSPPQPTEYSSALKPGLFNATRIYQRRYRANCITPPQSPKSSPKLACDHIDTTVFYYPERNVRLRKPRGGYHRMVLAASDGSQADKNLLAALDAPTLDPIETLGWDSEVQLDEVSFPALTDMCDIFKSYGLEYNLVSAAHS